MRDSDKHGAAAQVAKFLWSKMQERGYSTADYGGLIPITTPAQAPEPNSIGKPYVVYDYTPQPSGFMWLVREVVVTFEMYSNTVGPINEFVNIFLDDFNKHDESGRELNEFLRNSGYQYANQFDFKYMYIVAGGGPEPPSQEGGWLDGFMSVRVGFTQEME